MSDPPSSSDLLIRRLTIRAALVVSTAVSFESFA
jgi:hypothetical protein